MHRKSRWPPIRSHAARDFLRRLSLSQRRRFLPVVRLLHDWLKTENLTLSTLTVADVQRFLQSSLLTAGTRVTYRHYLVDYLVWLHAVGRIHFPPTQFRLRHRGMSIPTFATDFLATHRYPSLRAVVRAFHHWILARDLSLSALGVDDIESFLARPVLNRCSRAHYRRVLLQYLRWLHQDGRLSLQPDVLRHRRVPKPWVLPSTAVDFLKSIAPTRRPGTCHFYRGTLAQFHRWLNHNGFAADSLVRTEISPWFHFLVDKGLRPSTRIGLLHAIRNYLRWLAEQGILKADPEDLIRGSDFPKMPQYLPRPLPPDVDRELQRRLAASDGLYQRGLLLMRSTGIRVGELAALQCDCIRLDPKGRPFLKVPLGKLQNERLVPLEPSIHELVQLLQRSGPDHRHWLLEDPPGHQTQHHSFARILRETAQGLKLAEPLTTHRLRHSYATTLLAGGMSLVGVMRLLGHRDYRMTLRYTAITDETIGREYEEALKRLETRYRMPLAQASTDADPVKLLGDVTRWIRNNLDEHADVRPLLKRIQRIQVAVQRLQSHRSRK